MALPKKIAVTGGIASGKTTVCHLFEELGAYYVSADEIVHQLLVPSTPLGKDIIQLFGTDIVEGQHISRERVAERVFSQPFLLNKLERRIHPEVQRVIEADYKAISQQDIPLFVAEIPLLFEAGLESFYDRVIVVVADETVCQNRFHRPEEYRLRAQRFMPIEEKIKKADFVIVNDGTLETLRKKIEPIFNSLRKL